MQNLTSSQTQVASEISDRLRSLTDLESVHVIPIERIGLSENLSGTDRPIEPFSERLGALAADYVAYEMGFAMLLKVLENQKSEAIFKIGVAAGSTVRAIVEDLRIPEILRQRLSQSRLKILVSPLAIGPIPETASSAGFIASNLCIRLRQSLGDIVQFDPLAKKTPSKDGYELRMVPEVRESRDEDPSVISKEREKLRASKMRYDWVLTGVGSIQTGQLVEHLKLRFGDEGMSATIVSNEVVGDICSRMYDSHGLEQHKEDGDKFVGISFRWLQFLATSRSKKGQRSHRVFAVTGGEDKYHAIYALIKNTKEELRAKRDARCPFNALVTDELTARRLIRDLLKGDPGLNNTRMSVSR